MLLLLLLPPFVEEEVEVVLAVFEGWWCWGWLGSPEW